MDLLREMSGLGYPVIALAAVTDAATDGVNASFAPVMPFKGHITAVQMVPSANVTANGSNFRTLTVRNKGTNGLSGTTAVASRSWATTNSVLSTPELFTLNGTAANLEVQAGDVLDLQQGHTGTGLIIPASSYVIFLLPRF